MIGCCGFPGPPTRYYQELAYVEVQDVHVATPGMGTIRRWKREAPPGFVFAAMAPREVGAEAYRAGKIVDAALAQLEEVMRELAAARAVFVAPADFAPSRANKSQLRDFLEAGTKRFGRVVWEPPPGWDADEASALCESAGAVAARDPLAHGPARGREGYYRLAGPAGHKSRYEDPAIERLAALAREAPHERATYVFSNVDMFADAKRLRRLVGAGG